MKKEGDRGGQRHKAPHRCVEVSQRLCNPPHSLPCATNKVLTVSTDLSVDPKGPIQAVMTETAWHSYIINHASVSANIKKL